MNKQYASIVVVVVVVDFFFFLLFHFASIDVLQWQFNVYSRESIIVELFALNQSFPAVCGQ